jgi:hypothetical protein
MRWKLLFGIGFVVGYILGTKAGKERYEQIRAAAQDISENPTVQSAAGVVQQRASEVIASRRRQTG